MYEIKGESTNRRIDLEGIMGMCLQDSCYAGLRFVCVRRTSGGGGGGGGVKLCHFNG